MDFSPLVTAASEVWAPLDGTAPVPFEVGAAAGAAVGAGTPPALSTSIPPPPPLPPTSGSVLRFSMAAVTLELESAEVPDAGEKVSSFSVPPVLRNSMAF